MAYGANIVGVTSYMTHGSQEKKKTPHCSAMAPPFNNIVGQNGKLSKLL